MTPLHQTERWKGPCNKFCLRFACSTCPSVPVRKVQVCFPRRRNSPASTARLPRRKTKEDKATLRKHAILCTCRSTMVSCKELCSGKKKQRNSAREHTTCRTHLAEPRTTGGCACRRCAVRRVHRHRFCVIKRNGRPDRSAYKWRGAVLWCLQEQLLHRAHKERLADCRKLQQLGSLLEAPGKTSAPCAVAGGDRLELAFACTPAIQGEAVELDRASHTA